MYLMLYAENILKLFYVSRIIKLFRKRIVYFVSKAFQKYFTKGFLYKYNQKPTKPIKF